MHGQLAIDHLRSVELETQEPSRLQVQLRLDFFIRNGEERLDEHRILLDDGGARVGVVPNLNRGCDGAQRGIRKLLLHILRQLRQPGNLRLQVYGQGRCLDVRGDIDDLLQTWHTKCDVLTGNTSIMERVKRHLRSGLSDGLRREGSAHLTRVYERLVELGFDFTQHPVEGLPRQMPFLQHTPRCKVGAQVHPERQRRILLRLPAEPILAADDDQALAQLLYGINNIHGVEVARLAAIDMEDLDGVLHDTGQVDGQVMGLDGGNTGEDEVPQEPAVLDELRVLLIQLGLQLQRAIINAHLQHTGEEAARGIRHVHTVIVLKFAVAQAEGLDVLLLDERAIHAILAVHELNQIAQGIPDGTIVANHDILECFDETALDITSLGRLDGGIDKTLATGHGVEEEFLRRQPAEVRILDETA